MCLAVNQHHRYLPHSHHAQFVYSTVSMVSLAIDGHRSPGWFSCSAWSRWSVLSLLMLMVSVVLLVIRVLRVLRVGVVNIVQSVWSLWSVSLSWSAWSIIMVLMVSLAMMALVCHPGHCGFLAHNCNIHNSVLSPPKESVTDSHVRNRQQ